MPCGWLCPVTAGCGEWLALSQPDLPRVNPQDRPRLALNTQSTISNETGLGHQLHSKITSQMVQTCSCRQELFWLSFRQNMSLMFRAFRAPHLRSAAQRTADYDYVTIRLDCLKFVTKTCLPALLCLKGKVTQKLIMSPTIQLIELEKVLDLVL